MKKALAINGSPRKNGNAANMLDIAVRKAEQVGYDVVTYKGCMACKKTGECIVHDDIDAIRESLLTCDLVMISSPTYFANVSAPVKNMFDRLVDAIMDDNSSMIPKPKLSKRQKYLLMTTCNTPFPINRLGSQSTGTLKAMNEFFHTAGMKCIGKIVFAGTRGKNQIPSHIVKKIENLF